MPEQLIAGRLLQSLTHTFRIVMNAGNLVGLSDVICFLRCVDLL